MKNRNVLIDAAKGIGILLVVLGHAIQSNITGFDNILFRIIYSFHMPLFMFLSGCVAKYGDSRSITRNITRLLVPFLAWYLIAFGVKWIHEGVRPDFYEYMLNLFRNPDNGLWFLWVLFLCHVCFYLMSQAQKYIKLVGAVVVFLLVQAITIDVLGFGLLRWHFVFFVAGYLTLHYKDLLGIYRYWLMAVSAVSFILLFTYWQFNNNELFINLIAGLPGIIKAHPLPLVKIYRYCVAFAGIGFMLSVVYFLLKLNPVKVFLTTIGLYTMDIYVSHQLLLNFSFGESLALRIITCFICALSLSLLLAYFLKKIPVVKTILYGVPG